MFSNCMSKPKQSANRQELADVQRVRGLNGIGKWIDDCQNDAWLAYARIKDDDAWEFALFELMRITPEPQSLRESLWDMESLLQQATTHLDLQQFDDDCGRICANLPDTVLLEDAKHICSLTAEHIPVYRVAGRAFRSPGRMRKPLGVGDVLTTENKGQYFSPDVLHVVKYYKGIMLALWRLPQQYIFRGATARGMNFLWQRHFETHFYQNRRIVFFEPRSSSVDPAVAEGFAGQQGTILEIHVDRGYRIGDFSWFPEEEILLPMFSHFQVFRTSHRTINGHRKDVVQLHQIQDFPWSLRCPISLKLMKDPITAPDGRAYDRSSLLTVKRRFPGFDASAVCTNKPLEKVIEDFQKNGWQHLETGSPLLCPLSFSLMSQPMTDERSGETHDLAWLVEQQKRRPGVSPYKNNEAHFTLNLPLQRAIFDFTTRRSALASTRKSEPPPVRPPSPPISIPNSILAHGAKVFIKGDCSSCQGANDAAIVPLAKGTTYDIGADLTTWCCSRCSNYFEPNAVIGLGGAKFCLTRTMSVDGSPPKKTQLLFDKPDEEPLTLIKLNEGTLFHAAVTVA